MLTLASDSIYEPCVWSDTYPMTGPRQISNCLTSDFFDRQRWLTSLASLAVLTPLYGMLPYPFDTGLSRKEKVNEQEGQHALNQRESMASVWLQPQVGSQLATRFPAALPYLRRLDDFLIGILCL